MSAESTYTGGSSFGGGGPTAVALASALMGIATILLALRAYTSFQLVGRTTWDLAWVFAAYVLGLVAQIFLALATHYGIGNHLTVVDPTQLDKGFLYIWIFNVSTIMSTGFGKLAILDILLHIQGHINKTRRWVLYFIGASTMILNINQSVLVWFQCQPRSKLWNALEPGSCPHQHLILSFGVFQGSWSAACDFFIAFYPSLIFWKLQLSWPKRLGLCALFAGGSVAGAAAAIKTSYILTLLASHDITYAILPLINWAETELWLIIIMGSLPTLRPLFVKLFRTVSSYRISRMSKNTNTSNNQSGAHHNSKGGGGSVHLRSLPVKDHRLSHGAKGGLGSMSGMERLGSESEEDILPKGHGIVVKSDYDVAYAERGETPAGQGQKGSMQVLGPGAAL